MSSETGQFRRRLRQREISHYLAAGDDAPGLDTRELAPGTVLVVRTCNTAYTLRFDDPATGACSIASDGKHVTEEVEADFRGATLSGRGTMLRIGWVLFGYKLVIALDDAELLTSVVRGAWVDGRPVVPVSPVC